MESEIFLACASLAAVGVAFAAGVTRRPARRTELPPHPATGDQTAPFRAVER